jgi:hypothetical protein
MPSSLHEVPLALLDERPELLLELVAAAGGPTIVADAVEPVRDTFAMLDPATYAADRVYVARWGDAAVATLVVEMQRSADDEKYWTWPFYLASAHQRMRMPTWLVVVALEGNVAGWARRPIGTFHGGGLVPIVIGPDDVPRASRGASVELAVLSTMTHGRGEEGGAIAAAALLAIRDASHLDEARVRLYNDVVMASIDAIARMALEATMKTEGWIWQSEMARHWVGVGREEGREEGREQGRAEGVRDSIRTLCDALGVDWTDSRSRAVASASPTELDALFASIAQARRWPDGH